MARSFEFSFFMSAIPTAAPIAGLKLFQFNSSELGLLFASMGAGSVNRSPLHPVMGSKGFRLECSHPIKLGYRANLSANSIHP
jgi:hypothetical protein